MPGSENGRKQVQFGLFDWIELDENLPAQTLEDRLKLLEYADSQDFFCYHLAEHHTTPLRSEEKSGRPRARICSNASSRWVTFRSVAR